MGIHEYGYYDTRTHPINMRVSKIPVPAGNEFYLQIPASTDIFDIWP